MKARRGFALVAALALLLLGGALLTTATLASRALRAAAYTTCAMTRADAAAPRVIATALAGWSTRQGTLAIGAAIDESLPADASDDGIPLVERVQWRRLSVGRWALAADVLAGIPARPVARRRMVLLLERADTSAAPDSALAPQPVREWPLVSTP